MAKISDIRRIIVEEYEDQYQDLVTKLGFTINTFTEQVVSAFNKNIDFSNLKQNIKIIEITVDATGKPILETKINPELTDKLNGIICIKAENLTNTQHYPINSPFISYGYSNNLISIKNVSGLQNNEKYRLTLLLL